MSRDLARRRFVPGSALQPLETRCLMAASVTAEVLRADRQSAAVSERFWPKPIDQMGPGETYQGLTGGLYGAGSNVPPRSLLDAANAANAAIRPLSITGRPSSNGRIGVVAIGQSTTNQWFPYFQAKAAGNARQLRRGLFFVNGGQDGRISTTWAGTDTPWGVLSGRVGGGRNQVQVVFLDSAMIYGERYGSAQAEAGAYRRQLDTIIGRAKSFFPNLKLVYAFPFHWAGAASADRAVTEPASYAMQFGIQELVTKPSRKAPAVVWGPDIWSQTMNGGYYYDGVHFTSAGRAQMARVTWKFLREDFSSRWFWR
ncbi:MAG: hypothetical protein U0800_06550 [Isosphaeraceae bacterium]